MREELRAFLIPLLYLAAILAVVAWVISFAIRSALKHREGSSPHLPHVSQARSMNYDESKVQTDGPGRYMIVGVDRESKMDTTWHVQASSAANAKAKAELEGIVVTDVRRE